MWSMTKEWHGSGANEFATVGLRFDVYALGFVNNNVRNWQIDSNKMLILLM